MSTYRYNVIIDVEMNTSGAKGGAGQVQGAFTAMERDAQASATKQKRIWDDLLTYKVRNAKQASADVARINQQEMSGHEARAKAQQRGFDAALNNFRQQGEASKAYNHAS